MYIEQLINSIEKRPKMYVKEEKIEYKEEYEDNNDYNDSLLRAGVKVMSEDEFLALLS